MKANEADAVSDEDKARDFFNEIGKEFLNGKENLSGHSLERVAESFVRADRLFRDFPALDAIQERILGRLSEEIEEQAFEAVLVEGMAGFKRYCTDMVRSIGDKDVQHYFNAYLVHIANDLGMQVDSFGRTKHAPVWGKGNNGNHGARGR